MWERLAEMRRRVEAIDAELATPAVAVNAPRVRELSKERARLEPAITLLGEYERVQDQLSQARDVAAESDDAALQEMAQSEVSELEERLQQLTSDAKRALIPADPNDDRNVIIEIRGGTGGDEAGLWAADIFRAYVRYAERRHWKTDVISLSENAAGGFKEVVFSVTGKTAFSRFKYESGVHRVQRVPKTETQGRIHTSTATVAVLPEAQEVDVQINPDDIRMDRFHSGGAGGQNVNKVESGIRLTHIPSGLVVTCTDERSQMKNRQKAMAVLRARLYDQERRTQAAERADARREQVGSGERAEKIRTYNFPENRVTDHRYGLTTHSLPLVLDGDLDDLIDGAASASEAKTLQDEVA